MKTKPLAKIIISETADGKYVISIMNTSVIKAAELIETVTINLFDKDYCNTIHVGVIEDIEMNPQPPAKKYENDELVSKADITLRLSNVLLANATSFGENKTADNLMVSDIAKIPRNHFFRFRNFGKKSMTELDDFIASKNMYFGMK